jgi:DNA-binding response OmpR family regulator
MVTHEQQTEKTALIVEDDKAVLQLIRLYLAQAGYRILEAQDGVAGLRMALEESPDIVLLDLNLPGMDGIEVCKNVRSESDVPIIMVTARVEEDDRLTGLDSRCRRLCFQAVQPAGTRGAGQRSPPPNATKC